ncbi:hypothetical protein ETAA8_35090 [Anatilimnocola aggregata]|uniref:Two-component sensor histidine kinase n=1 Tax=Anatilimnocola aggregata TaxID=2528021 RepID=A0A517YDX1_9BACT|nr:hypothetical protein [Anatilimnocola aggregata]QDU28409.1 hypothetical protein ETAA8_35090 [Anatilimnocola aggregata]
MSRSEKLGYGWGLVGVLLVAVIVATFLQRGPSSPGEPDAQAIEQLRVATEQQQAVILSQLAGNLTKQDPSAQILLLQGAPGAPPVVAANVIDEDDGEGPTHWPAPWPAVQEAMKQPVLSPTLVAGTYAGAKFKHRLIPLEPTGTRVLLINSAAAPASWFSLRNVLFVATGLLALSMVVVQLSEEE